MVEVHPLHVGLFANDLSGVDEAIDARGNRVEIDTDCDLPEVSML